MMDFCPSTNLDAYIAQIVIVNMNRLWERQWETINNYLGERQLMVLSKSSHDGHNQTDCRKKKLMIALSRGRDDKLLI
jgi:hypothetical protein